MSRRFFTGPAVIFAYVVGAAAIIGGYFQSYIILLLALAIFLAWDVTYAFAEGTFAGRTVTNINDGITRARTYVSWFIALYGALLGLSFTAGTPAGSSLLDASEAAGVPLWMLASPLAFAFVSMLFVPITLEQSGAASSTPSTALKCVFALVIYMEKVILLLFGHLGLRVLSGWSL